MSRVRVLAAASALALAAVSQASAAEIVRDAGVIATMPIQGVTLDTPVEEAFGHLTGLGYHANGIETYADWSQSGIEMVRGSYTTDEGESHVILQRANGHLVNIAETWNRPRNPFDTDAEMDAVRNHFAASAEECPVNAARTGACRVGDAEEDANLVYGVNAYPAMLLRYASRNHELKDAQ